MACATTMTNGGLCRRGHPVGHHAVTCVPALLSDSCIQVSQRGVRACVRQDSSRVLLWGISSGIAQGMAPGIAPGIAAEVSLILCQ